jgi:molybdate/tungstate transport system substrate-binding protein
LPFISLPDEINLSNPDMDAKWYKTVQFTITLPNGKESALSTQPLVFSAAVLKDTKQPAMAEKFVQFLQSAEGQKLFRDNGYSPAKGGPIE